MIEHVTAFRVKRDQLSGYGDVAHQETVKRITQLTSAPFEQPVEHLPGTTRPVWQSLAGMAGDSDQHAGQIADLRGIITGYRWRG